jgi:uncharacterized Zn finger protein
MLELTEDKIRAMASPQSYERGVDYYQSGAVFNTQRMDDELRGQCRGSDYTPYRVSVQLSAGGILSTYCTCPYDWGGICKHIVALLLTWVHEPDAFQLVAPIDERLANKSKEELIALVQEMLKREPDLERLLDLPLHPDPESPFNLDAFRRHIEHILLDDYPDPQELAMELGAMVETAERLAAEENWSYAGDIYNLILNEVVPSYDELNDEDGDVSYVLQQCAMGLGQCLSAGTPDDATRRSWLETLLEAEFKDIDMGGIELAYPAQDILVEQASDEEWQAIEARIRKKIASLSDRYSSWGQESLVNLLVRRLESTGRETEIADLIFEFGSAKQRTFELLRLGRVAEAVAIAKQYFSELPGLVLQFADALVEAGEPNEATTYITNQLGTRYRTSYLAWLAQRAEALQGPETALRWWLSLFRESPGLDNYRNLRRLAQWLKEWEAIRQDLIQNLEVDQKWDLLIQIALEEGDVRRALELLPRQHWGQRDLQVAQAAEADYPRAAIEIYSRRIDRLIAARGRGNYHEASVILQRVKELYKRLGAQAEWEPFIKELRTKHARLPALQDELKKTGL